MKTICPECYSDNSRVTPLLEPRHCLENHLQYICGTCGRCICIDKDEKRGLQRWNFPFKSLEVAKLYLRTADATAKTSCGIYEILSANGRRSYKIFKCMDELKDYLKKNSDKSCVQMEPLFTQDSYKEFSSAQIRKLSANEVEQYLKEQKNCKRRK
nr:hypothetical protein [Lutispora saccharofermentans]